MQDMQNRLPNWVTVHKTSLIIRDHNAGCSHYRHDSLETGLLVPVAEIGRRLTSISPTKSPHLMTNRQNPSYKSIIGFVSHLVTRSTRSEYELVPMSSTLAADPEKKGIASNDDDVLVQLGYTQGNQSMLLPIMSLILCRAQAKLRLAGYGRILLQHCHILDCFVRSPHNWR